MRRWNSSANTCGTFHINLTQSLFGSHIRHRDFNISDSYRRAGYASESGRWSSFTSRRFRPRKYTAKDIRRIEIGCAFFVPFFAQAKKGEDAKGADEN